MLVYLFMNIAFIFARGESFCPHHYTIQPPEDIICDPYIHRSLQIECAVTGSNLHKIQWYFSPDNNMNMFDTNVLEIANSTKYMLTEVSDMEKLSMTLIVQDLNEENDVGTYWCRAFLLDGTMLFSPNSFELKTSDMYTAAFACPLNVPLRRSTSTCAQIIGPTPTTSTVLLESSPLPTITLPSIIQNEEYTTLTVEATLTSMPIKTGPSESFQRSILYIIIGLVGFLFLLCLVFVLTICFLCKKVKIKGPHRAVELGYISKQASQRPEFSIFPIDSSIQTENNKSSSTGIYAEIGPELMSSVHFHTIVCNNNSHYSEISDVMLQPKVSLSPEVRESDQPQETGNKENPYDVSDPSDENTQVLASSPHKTSILSQNYSRLESMVPLACIADDVTDGETHTDSSTQNGQHYYHTLEESVSGIPTLSSYNSSGSEQEEDYTGTVLCCLPTIPEHPYHILEHLDSIEGTEALYAYGDAKNGTTPSVNCDYDRLVDPQLYSMLSRSISDAGLSRIYDIKSGLYSKLEIQLNPKLKSKLDPSTDIFDDVQYLTPKPTDVHQEADASPPSPKRGQETGTSDLQGGLTDLRGKDDFECASKYCGDYERDPVYMEKYNIKQFEETQSSLYQKLDIAEMDPIQDYENCPNP